VDRGGRSDLTRKEPVPIMNEDIKAPRRLWLTADFTEVVLEEDPRAAFLLAGKGCVIPTKVITPDGPLEVVVPEEFLQPDVEELSVPKAEGDAKPKKERKPRASKPKPDPDQTTDPAAGAEGDAGDGADAGTGDGDEDQADAGDAAGAGDGSD
jgi:hypothetical protein